MIVDTNFALGKPSVIDLFCGGGGFGLGAELAGFRSSIAIDIDPDLQAVYRQNFPKTKAVQHDIATLDHDGWRFLTDGVRPTVVIGGPPCQGFSRIGKRDRQDPRNTLIGHFFRHVAILRPKAFVMENVEGLLDEGNREILDIGIASLGDAYTMVGPITINAVDFGAPTTRKRVVLIGFDPDQMEKIALGDISGSVVGQKVTVREAISDLPLPVIQSGADDDWGWARMPIVNPSDNELSAYALEMRRLPPVELGWPVAIERLAQGEISGLMETIHTDPVRSRFGLTRSGEVESTSRYPRLAWDGYCPTLRAGTGKDKGSFQSVRPIHPSEPRVITVREAARLQGFPDWFTFGRTKWHSFRVIGNSVSPKVSAGILTTIKNKLKSSESSARMVG